MTILMLFLIALVSSILRSFPINLKFHQILKVLTVFTKRFNQHERRWFETMFVLMMAKAKLLVKCNCPEKTKCSGMKTHYRKERLYIQHYFIVPLPNFDEAI
ncbi:unnamed protein product [Orchesella dallaii]|uniref:Uncharacterized protein n=1 Tax=Orchesella dallaii TaxID=48710 RepID=A0ABP1QMG0_9HEXA